MRQRIGLAHSGAISASGPPRRRMRRRDVMALLASAAAWPLAARAQQSTMPILGVLESESDQIFLTGLRNGLRESGYLEGQNLAIEYRSAEGRNNRLPALAADLVRLKVAVLVAAGTPATAAAKKATSTIPVVFNSGADPIAAGFVASLRRPGGNATGVTILLTEVVPKQFELLHSVLPKATALGFLYNQTNLTLLGSIVRDAEAVAQSFGFKLHLLPASSEGEIEHAFAKAAELRADGLVIGPDLFFTNRSEQLATLTARYKLPAIYHYRGFAVAGGLMSYGTDLLEACRLQGNYAGRILKGEKPADLPVQRATKVELIVNLKVAKALGVTMPLPLLARADEVIE
jgi:putative tryptophan/tyrosine transport system substrate-binding protein